MYILEEKNNWKGEKKIKSLNFAESNVHQKPIVNGSFETLLVQCDQ